MGIAPGGNAFASGDRAANSLTVNGGTNGIRLTDVDVASVRLAQVTISNTSGAGIDIDEVGGRFEIDDCRVETFVDVEAARGPPSPTGTGEACSILLTVSISRPQPDSLILQDAVQPFGLGGRIGVDKLGLSCVGLNDLPGLESQ